MPTNLTNTPQVLGEDKIAILAGTATNVMPTSTELTTALRIEQIVNKMPQFFPDREKIEYKVLSSKQAKSLLGSRASMDGTMSVYYTAELLAAHTKMIEEQEKTAGCFWLVWYIKAEDRTVAVRATVDDMIKTPEDESGGLSLKEIMITNTDEAIETMGDAFEQVLP